MEDAAGPSESKKKKDDDGNLPSSKAQDMLIFSPLVKHIFFYFSEGKERC